MLHHVSIGVSDVPKACEFYDAVLAALGYRRVMEFLPYAVAYGEAAPQFWVQLPHDQQAAGAGNGSHVGFTAASQRAVEAFHAAALKAGAKDEGAPGPRPDYSPNYYGAFVRDPYGNKIEAVFFSIDQKKAQAKSRAKPKRKAKASNRKNATTRKTVAGRQARSRARKR
ncbi:MAG: VOC family protein [Alphaproteobacteria bacterium]|nr:VOC family protein [Alphaproteobacteria bacterium]